MNPKIKVWDNDGKTFDRYTVYIGKDTYFMSHNPMSPQGINQYVGEDAGRPWNQGGGALGKPLNHIPNELQAAITKRLKERS